MSDFVKVPILRGFNNIKPLYEAVYSRGGFICGGYARYCASPTPNNKPIEAGDIDIYSPTQEVFESIKDFLIKEIGFQIRTENDNALTLKRLEGESWWTNLIPIQIIKPFKSDAVVTMGSMEEILSNFDFTVTRIAIISPTECLADESFLKDEEEKYLRIENIHCPISSTLRFMKYAKKGYFTRPIQILKLFTDWSDRDEEYQTKLIELFGKSEMTDSNGDQVKMSEKDIDELEALLKID